METIYTILFTAPYMEPLLFAALSRNKLAAKVRAHINTLCAEDADHGEPLGPYTDLDDCIQWMADSFGYKDDLVVHTEDL